MTQPLTASGAWCAALLASLSLAACVDGGLDGEAQATDGASIAIAIAPLNLPGVTNAEYEIIVRNGADQVVFSRVIDSDSFGDGVGSASFVGPCDASSNDNTVSVELLRLFEGNPAVLLTDYQDAGVQTRTVNCRENEDASVTFNLTILRDAVQGFFDVAVNFNNIFCSAKLDCADGDNALLFDGGSREETVVLAFACAGDNTADADTVLHMTDVTVSCDGGAGTATVNPSAGPGNLAANIGYTTTGVAPLFGAAVYRGEEQLPGYAKRYWNVALGFDPDSTLTSCTIEANATASDGQFLGTETPANTAYPLITYDAVHLVDNAGACINRELGDGNGVSTVYAPIGSPASFAWSDPVADKLVFVTDETWAPSSFGSLAGADALCNAAAAAGDPILAGKTFTAWISSITIDGGTRISHAVGNYVLIDGTVIAEDFAALTDGGIDNPINLTELGNTIGAESVATATSPSGARYDGHTCSNWTSSGSTSSGSSNRTDGDWSHGANPSCDSPHHLYCFQD